MFEQNINQCSSSNEKNLILSFSLLMRLFEWCHEDAKDDVAMHKAMEKLVAFNDGVNPLTIDVYDCVVAGANDGQESDKNMGTEENNNQENQIDDYIEPMKQGCFTELDINDAINKVNHCYHHNELVNAPKMTFDKGFKQHDLRQQPTVITINGDEVPYCNNCSGDMLDTDTLQEIQNIINAGKF